MALSKESIIVGAALVYINDDATEALPTLTANEPARTAFDAATTTGWRNAGYTTGGIELVYAPDFGEVEVDQLLDVAKIYKQRQSVTVNTTFAQAELRNLLFAWGQPASTLDVTTEGDDETLVISAGNLGDAPEERQMAFIGPAPGSGRERVYNLNRVLSVESSTHSLSRADASTVPVSLRCLPDDDGEYGRIVQRRRVAATP